MSLAGGMSCRSVDETAAKLCTSDLGISCRLLFGKGRWGLGLFGLGARLLGTSQSTLAELPSCVARSLAQQVSATYSSHREALYYSSALAPARRRGVRVQTTWRVVSNTAPSSKGDVKYKEDLYS